MTADFWALNAALALGGAVFSWGLVRLAAYAPVLDRPNGRSSHAAPTPRTGGLAVAAGVWAMIALHRAAFGGAGVSGSEAAFIGLSATALGLGFADDLRLLGYRGKFLGQIILAALFVVLVGGFESFPMPGVAAPTPLHPAVGFVVTALWILGFVNVFNFMDGLNGMAGGAALVAAGFLAMLGLAVGAPFVHGVGLAVVAATGGFLLENGRGRIFMGDAGSHFLGFVLAGAVVLATRAAPEAVSPLIGGVLFAPFLLDSAVTLLRRAIRGEPVHVAHRDHLYQRLHRSGWSHLEVSALYAACGVGCGVAAAVARANAPDFGWTVAGGVTAILIGLGIGLDRAISAPARR